MIAGIDTGGLTREFLTLAIKAIGSDDHGYFNGVTLLMKTFCKT